MGASPSYRKAFLMAREEILTVITFRDLTDRGFPVWHPGLLPISHPRYIAIVECKMKNGIDVANQNLFSLSSAFETYFAQIQNNACVLMSDQQLKALRSIEDVLVWTALDVTSTDPLVAKFIKSPYIYHRDKAHIAIGP